MDGKFTLSAFPNQELEVSYLGYQNARIKVTDKKYVCDSYETEN